MLKAGRRPMASDAIPQKEAPMIRPTKRAQVANREWLSEIPNSLATGVSVRATPYIQLDCYLASQVDNSNHTCNQRLYQRLISKAHHIKFQTNVCLLVSDPAKTTQDKKTPLIAAHANILDRSVDDLCFAY